MKVDRRGCLADVRGGLRDKTINFARTVVVVHGTLGFPRPCTPCNDRYNSVVGGGALIVVMEEAVNDVLAVSILINDMVEVMC